MLEKENEVNSSLKFYFDIQNKWDETITQIHNNDEKFNKKYEILNFVSYGLSICSKYILFPIGLLFMNLVIAYFMESNASNIVMKNINIIFASLLCFFTISSFLFNVLNQATFLNTFRKTKVNGLFKNFKMKVNNLFQKKIKAENDILLDYLNSLEEKVQILSDIKEQEKVKNLFQSLKFDYGTDELLENLKAYKKFTNDINSGNYLCAARTVSYYFKGLNDNSQYKSLQTYL